MDYREMALYKEIFELEGLKVVDNCFLDIYMREIPHSSDFGETIGLIQEQCGFYDYLRKFVDKHLSFPEELISEFWRGSVHFGRLARKLNKIRCFSHGERRSQLKTNQTKLLGAKLCAFVRKRKKLSNEVFCKYPTERYLPDKNGWEGTFFPAVLEMTPFNSSIKVNCGEHYSRFSNPEHKINDERIFAKSLELSQFYPVFILTKDRDFIRMRGEFYRNIHSLSEKYGFKIPRYGVSLAFNLREGYRLFGSHGEKQFVC